MRRVECKLAIAGGAQTISVRHLLINVRNAEIWSWKFMLCNFDFGTVEIFCFKMIYLLRPILNLTRSARCKTNRQ